MGSESLESSKPLKPSNVHRPVTGPFILEDDDDDDMEPAVEPEADSASLNITNNLSHGRPKGLREISPNTSQHRMENDVEANTAEHDAEIALVDIPEKNDLSAKNSPQPSLLKENDPTPMQPTHNLTNELAEILKRQSASSSSIPAAPAKRKSRPLGRNISSISNRSGSVAAAPHIPSDIYEENSAADGFDYPKTVPALPPSTQLGYDTPEAEAHRKQMSEKMGTDMLLDDGVGKRVASVGTVKDSSSRSAVGGRVKGRSRKA